MGAVGAVFRESHRVSIVAVDHTHLLVLQRSAHLERGEPGVAFGIAERYFDEAIEPFCFAPIGDSRVSVDTQGIRQI